MLHTCSEEDARHRPNHWRLQLCLSTAGRTMIQPHLNMKSGTEPVQHTGIRTRSTDVFCEGSHVEPKELNTNPTREHGACTLPTPHQMQLGHDVSVSSVPVAGAGAYTTDPPMPRTSLGSSDPWLPPRSQKLLVPGYLAASRSNGSQSLPSRCAP